MIDFKNIEMDEEYPIFDVLDIRKRVVKLKNFCLDCGKEKDRRALRCNSCAQKNSQKNPTKKMIEQLEKLHNLPRSEKQLETIRENLKKAHNLPRSEKQIEQLKNAQKASTTLPRSEKQIAVNLENIKKAQDVAATLPRSEKQLAANLENIKKAHNLPRSEKQLENIKRAQEVAKNGVWVSSWEDKFYLKCLTKMFFLKDIEKQYYLKGLNHAFDFAIPSQKLLFEIDGDYWHSQNPERDIEIDKFAKSAGWFVIRFNDEKMKTLKII